MAAPHLTVPSLVTKNRMRGLAIGLAIAVIVFVVSGGHFFFLPLLFVPFGLFSVGNHRRKNAEYLANPRRPPMPVTRRSSRRQRRTAVLSGGTLGSGCCQIGI